VAGRQFRSRFDTDQLGDVHICRDVAGQGYCVISTTAIWQKERATTTMRRIMRSLIRQLIKPMFVVVPLSLSGCVSMTATPETVASVSDESICEMVDRVWPLPKEEQSLIRGEMDRRGLVCDDGKVVGYRRQQQKTPTATKTPEDKKTERQRFDCDPKQASKITEYETDAVEGYKDGRLFIDVTDGVKSASLMVEDPAGKQISFQGMYDQTLTEEKRQEYDTLGYEVSMMVFSNRHLSIPDAKILIMVHRQPDDSIHVTALRKEEHADLLLQLPCAKSK
jgi:hypothetical protein